MKIGIDARLYHETGVGRYIRNLIAQLQTVDSDNEYTVFLPQQAASKLNISNRRWQTRSVDIPWHSFSEQTTFIPILLQEDLDMVHFPYFSFPALYPRPFVVTIHDLIIDHYNTGQASTRSTFGYQLRRFAYRSELFIGLRRARRVIAVSRATQAEIVEHIGIDTDKISVVYEGVDPQLLKNQVTKRPIAESYFLYVGNSYPHKNLSTLIDGFADYLSKTHMDTKLVLVGPRDIFSERLLKYAQRKVVADHVQLKSNVSDDQLRAWYQHAKALVMPSRMEGFGLTVLEAMANNCLVLLSDIPVFRELFDSYGLFFPPQSSSALAACLEKMTTHRFERRQNRAYHHARTFLWGRAARRTKEVYEDSARL